MKIHPPRGARGRSRVVAALAVSGLLATALAPSLTAGAAAPVADPACPDAVPVAELKSDHPVTGLTVSHGTTPEPFTGTVLGVLEDGIAPDLDMILVRLTSPEIDRVGGVWAGMSGSPVYDDLGRLIGAVSYGLAFGPSPVAGVTPAEDMRALLTEQAAVDLTATRGAEKARLPRAIRRELVASGDATSAAADAGMRRLPIPVGVSGMVSTQRLNQAGKLLGMDDVRLFRSGAVSASTPETEIVPGGNLAASISYGDFSLVGIGTATMLCGGEVLGFGHPFSWTGQTSLTMHGANAIHVQEDPTFFPFKVANVRAPVGIVDEDRLAGIKGVLGTLPDTATVATTVTMTSGKTRTGVTKASLQDFLPDVAAIGLLINQDRVLDRIGKGSALVRFTVSGETAAGEPFTLVRTNRHVSDFDISFQTIFELGGDVWQLISNQFTDIRITDINVSVNMNDDPRRYSVGRVQVYRNGTWVTLDKVVRAKPGSTLRLRTTLQSFRNHFGTKTVIHSLTVPRVRVGTFGELTVSGGGGGEEFFAEEEFPVEDAAPTSFAGLLASLANAPRNDQLTTRITLFREEAGPINRRVTTLAGDVVEGSRFFELRIVR